MERALASNRTPAWTPLVEAIRQSSIRGHSVAAYERALDRLKTDGWDVAALHGWLPSPDDIIRVNRVYAAIGKALGPSASAEDNAAALHAINREFPSTDARWSSLRAIATARLSASPTPRRTTTDAAQALSATRLAPNQPLTRLPAIPSFGPSDNRIIIYIDESWPGNAKEGVIAGIVWRGESPNYADLAWMRTHSYAKESESVLKIIARLYACPRAFPFILPIQVDAGTARSRYDDLIGAALQLLLGWLLPSPQVRAQVSVQLERIGPHTDGSLRSDYFRGLLTGASQATSSRFGQWDLTEVRWCPKDEGYLPYADLLAHLALDHTNKNRQLGVAARYRELPGYVPFSFDLVPLLMRLDSFASSANVTDFLDVVSRIWDTRLCDGVLSNTRKHICSNARLQRLLTEELDRRCMSKQRDLKVLHPQVLAVRHLLHPLDEHAGIRLRLLSAAIDLQDANHLGNPTAVDVSARAYADIRHYALQHDRELTVHTDLQLAVHEVDSFRFDRAEILMEEIRTSQWFPYLSPYHRAAVLSSLGQHRSIGGQYEDADNLFATAIELFGEADLAPDERAGEVAQTAVYRAMNAIDGDLPHWQDYLAFGLCDFSESLEAATVRLATRQECNPYKHHLLTRSLFLRPTELAAALNAYLGVSRQWNSGDGQHPWELIDMYRLLLREAVAPSSSKLAGAPFRDLLRQFTGAATGATLRLIALMIAVVGFCHGDDWCGEYAREQIASLESELPDAGPEISSFGEMLNAASPDRVRDAIRVLPFNFH